MTAIPAIWNDEHVLIVAFVQDGPSCRAIVIKNSWHFYSVVLEDLRLGAIPADWPMGWVLIEGLAAP